ncbi:alpha/beta hydrolase [Yinghuangia soli]|uniref:Alpha/beta hydrolase n=1 Tax=Yinghuangia soli TaxID=2908204 RepID=A0AA41TYJ5_9ACTN|nr:alpha/beta hydrolase [Yinghuangia soli]MCF2527878.1 alpha/beta hydrolase [Yinghuangia soli]
MPSEEAQIALLGAGYALAGSSYDPNGSWWAMASAERDQLATLEAFGRVERPPSRTIAVGESMGGLITQRLAEDRTGRIDAALPLCGLSAGILDMGDYFLRGQLAITTLLLPGEAVDLVGFDSFAEAQASGQRLMAAVDAAQATPEGRARVALAAAYLNLPDWAEGTAGPPARDHVHARAAQQYAGMFQGLLNFLTWFGRYQIELALGGNPSSTVGADYAALLRSSRHADVVRALYAEAGLDLRTDLSALAAAPPIAADPAARAEARRTGTSGQALNVPTLNVHNTADPLAPVEQEASFAERVRAAGDGRLLRQAYVARPGHCIFSAAEVVASVRALDFRLDFGHWGPVAEPWALDAAAEATGLGAAEFVRYRPGRLVV